MNSSPTIAEALPRCEVAASAYLFRLVDWDAAESLERKLVYEAGESHTGSITLCEHPPGFVVGRSGSRAHLPDDPVALAARGYPVRWVARGGGVQLLQAGQVVVRVVAPLSPLGLSPAGFVDRLGGALHDAIDSFGLPTEGRDAAVWVRGRALATHGSAVRFGVGAGLAVVNVTPDLGLFRQTRHDARPRPGTSLEREVGARVRPALVRQRLLDSLSTRLGFARVSVFQSHPAIPRRTPLHAIKPAAR